MMTMTKHLLRRRFLAIAMWCLPQITVSLAPWSLPIRNALVSTTRTTWAIGKGTGASRRRYNTRHLLSSSPSSSSSSSSSSSPASPPAPILNGKRVLPYKIMQGALKGGPKRVAAVYAVLSSSYQRGTEGWEAVTRTGVTQDLALTLQQLKEADATELQIAHVRALSFSFPEPNVMQDVALEWRQQAMEAGAKMDEAWASAYLFDEDDEDEDDDEDDENDGPVVSPFDASQQTIKSPKTESEPNKKTTMDFTLENVEFILDDVRPYLIADGGNVAVERVGTMEEDGRKEVVLKLEGACGSCASSTVTMQMGIERVLKEQWPDVTIVQAQDDAQSQPTALTELAVQDELSRLRPALIAMGCVVQLRHADVETGVVRLKFQGSAKVRQGLELAIADVPFVTKVEFVEDDDPADDD